jgi:HlyD family secretion protein
MRILKKKWLGIVGVLLAIAIFGAFSLRGSKQPQYTTQRAERGDIRELVQATGTIDAVNTVQVGSQVSGTVAALNADFNTRVKKGQVIAQIDPALFRGALLQAQADLQNAIANAAAAKANVVKAQASDEQAQQQYQRTAALAQQGVVSRQQLDTDKANADSAHAAVAAAQAQLVQANAQVAQKQAAVKVAQTNLDYTTIHAPIDGTVTNRSVDVGQTVAASLQAPTLFTIAQDLTKMRVYAKTDESDVGQIKPGQQATFTVDAFPNQTFTGKVGEVRMNATTVQNVVTYDTVIDFDNPDGKLFPGMTAYVTIPVAEANATLKVPNSALHFMPKMTSQQLQETLSQNGIKAAGKRGAQQGNTAVLWKLSADKKLVPVQVATGLTDHTSTAVQVLAGALNSGDQLVTGAATTQAKTSGAPMGATPGGVGRMR